jgi:hypothetical protein
VPAQITMKTEQVLRVMRTAGLNTTAEQAEALGIDTSTWFRLTTGRTTLGPKVMAAILRRFPDWPFDELFLVADEKPLQVA